MSLKTLLKTTKDMLDKATFMSAYRTNTEQQKRFPKKTKNEKKE